MSSTERCSANRLGKPRAMPKCIVEGDAILILNVTFAFTGYMQWVSVLRLSRDLDEGNSKPLTSRASICRAVAYLIIHDRSLANIQWTVKEHFPMERFN